MPKSPKPNHVPKPTYPGGNKAMQRFIKQHLAYPKTAKKNRTQGTVTVRYSVDYRGVVVDARVKKSVDEACDAEAVRVVKLLRFTVPQNKKRKVRIHQSLNIHFKLPEAPVKSSVGTPAVQAQPTRISYTVVTTKGTSRNTEPVKRASSTNYSIRW